MSARPGIGPVLYWVLAVLLIGFGFLDLIAIGAPFLLMGLAMAALWPVRKNPRVYWSAMVGVFAFIVGFILAAPLGCTTSGGHPSLPGAPALPTVEHTTCTNVLGIDYSGPSPYEPSLLPALIAGLVSTLVGAAAAWLLGRRIRRRFPAL